MTEVDLKITGEVASLHLEPGDRIIVTISEEHRARIDSRFVDGLRNQLVAEFPDNKIIVLCGITLAREAA